MAKNARGGAPKPAYKTEWDLSAFYSSVDDPRIEKDVEEMGRLCAAFEKKYRGKTRHLTDEGELAKALADYEKLFQEIEGARPLRYLSYLNYLNGDDKAAEAKLNKLTMDYSEHENRLLPFRVSFKEVPEKRQREFLKSPKLERYRYFLKVLFMHNRYVLSEPEERIMNLKSQTSRSMWVKSSEKLASRQTVKWKGRDIPLAEARGMVSEMPLKERRPFYKLVLEAYKNVSDFAEAEMNAVVTDKKINDKLRGYERPYSSTVLSYENDEETVRSLVGAVTGRFDVSKRFYRLKAKLMKLKHLEVSDLNAHIGTTAKEIPFGEAYEMLRDVLNRVDPVFRDILVRYAEGGQIDVFPKKGKRGGAFCSSSVGQPTYVFLNHVSNFNSFMTLSHEMGHAIHAEFSKTQPPIYEGHTISVAEVASTLFEQIVFDDVFERLSDKDKMVALHDRIGDNMATVFRQVACFNFEVELHETIREKGGMTKEEMAGLMVRHMGSYLGPAVKVDADYGYVFVSWPHLRYMFYVYAYAYGQLISKAMHRKYKADPSYLEEIKKFLSAGCSMSPEDIFRSIGIDTRDPKFWEEGIKGIEEDIDRLEKLAKKA